MIRPALVALLLLTGCAGSAPTDEARVDAALLRLSDFPGGEGWIVEPEATDDPAQAEFQAALDKCEQDLDPTVETRSAERESDSFTRAASLAEQAFVSVGSNASVVADEDIRAALFGALETMVDCFGTALQEALIAQAGSADLAVTVSDPYSLDVSTDGQRTAGHAIQLSFQPDTLFVDLIVVEEGPTLLYGAFLHQGDLKLADEEQILAPAVKRLQEL